MLTIRLVGIPSREEQNQNHVFEQVVENYVSGQPLSTLSLNQHLETIQQLLAPEMRIVNVVSAAISGPNFPRGLSSGDRKVCEAKDPLQQVVLVRSVTVRGPVCRKGDFDG